MRHFLRALPLLAAALLPLAAQGPHHGRKPGLKAFPAFACLNLSESQKAQMKAVMERHHATLEAKGKTAQEAHQAMRTAMMDPTLSEADLKVLHDKVSDAQFAVVLEHRALRFEQVALLTPEQKAQWDKVRAQRFEENGHRGRGMHPGAFFEH